MDRTPQAAEATDDGRPAEAEGESALDQASSGAPRLRAVVRWDGTSYVLINPRFHHASTEAGKLPA